MKTVLKKIVVLGVLVFSTMIQSNCNEVKKVLKEIEHLLGDCECLCECAEAYRGGGDGVSGGGGQVRCIKKGNAPNCGLACAFQGVPGAVGGGNLLVCNSF